MILSIVMVVGYPLSYQDVEELLVERGIEVDHVTYGRLRAVLYAATCSSSTGS